MVDGAETLSCIAYAMRSDIITYSTQKLRKRRSKQTGRGGKELLAEEELDGEETEGQRVDWVNRV